MVVDSSALVCLVFDEPDAEAYRVAIAGDPVRMLSAATLLEAAMVVEARGGAPAAQILDELLATLGARVVEVTEAQARAAREAWRAFGKGRHPAALNFGDCFSYALARTSGQPLLCKGNDFPRTDLALVSVTP
ncbi:MAG: type II toxin-antitoxin system VapC family toxin [Myxococcota bacterium]